MGLGKERINQVTRRNKIETSKGRKAGKKERGRQRGGQTRDGQEDFRLAISRG